MRRREFSVFSVARLPHGPLAAPAQQSAMPVIGCLNSRPTIKSEHLVAAFRQ
jgi:hypothetical protein